MTPFRSIMATYYEKVNYHNWQKNPLPMNWDKKFLVFGRFPKFTYHINLLKHLI